MDFFGVLTMVGGLAMFLYGMNTMGDGLAKLSGGKLEKILEKLTSNRMMAVLLGLGVTAIIQSSSATTVMVVGFVNSGIMKLGQAVGIIMGANIGTTVTSWLLALVGIEGGSFFMQMLKPTSFSPILAIVGVIMMMLSKKDKVKDLGSIMIGFAVLMFGMDTMSEAVKPLRDVPEFTSLMTRFSNPVLGMIAGALITAVIQSSSASVGILQALCVTGSVTIGTALPIIMGQNIGTCVTALISAIGAKKNAKRAAMVHLFFNVIGTILFMLVFYTLNSLIHMVELSAVAGVDSIALIHTGFNVIATIILLPFAGLLEKLATLAIPTGKEEQVDEEFSKLDERFLDTPGYAVTICREVTCKMAELAQKELKLAMGLFRNYHEATAQEVKDLEERVDQYEDVLGTYMVKLSSKDLSKDESEHLSVLLHSINDLERISDHGVNIMESAKEMYDKGLSFSEKAMQELHVFGDAVRDIVDMSFGGFLEGNAEITRNVEPLEEVIDDLAILIKNRHIKRLQAGECTTELGFVLSDILTNYERVSDHCSNLAVNISQGAMGGYDAHEYLHYIKDTNQNDLKKEYDRLMKKYALPASRKDNA